MLSRFALAVVLLPFVFVSSARAASSQSPLQVEAVGQGLKVTLTVQRATYRRYALIRTVVDVQNMTQAPILIEGYPRYCASYNPDVRGLDTAGRAVYPPGLPFGRIPGPECPVAGASPIAAGETLSTPVYVIARGPGVQAAVTTAAKGNNHIDYNVVTTPAITLRLRPGKRPRATLLVTKGDVHAVIERPAGARGPLLYQSWAECPDGTSPSVAASRPLWTSTVSNRKNTFTPHCGSLHSCCIRPLEWHLLAGWPNLPVARVDYVRRPNARIRHSL